MQFGLDKKNIRLKKWLVVISFSALLTALAGCGKTADAENAILTQKPVLQGRTPITVLVKHAFSINNFEKAVEEEFPEIDIVQVGNYTRDMGIAEYESRLEHDDLTDIVMTWPLKVGEEYWEDRLLDLSGMNFTSRYNLSMLNDISKDGKLYYLPGPSQIRGIMYNKTLFEENGWEVPSDFEGFVALCKEIEASGIRSIQLGFNNSEVLDTAFVGYNYGNYFSKPEDIQWMTNYNNGEGSFGDHFGPALDTFQSMIDAGVWKESDLDIDYAQREKMLFTRQCAMAEDSVLMTRMGFSKTGSTDEFALMPFFNFLNEGREGDWVRLYMVCYIGMNKQLAEPENKEKYALSMELMNYISTPEGQEALAADTGAMFSSLIGMEPPDLPEIKDILPTLEHGRYAVFPQFYNAQEALREGLAGMLRGDVTKEAVIKMVDSQNIAPPEVENEVILGTASADFSLTETGSFVTDKMREQSDSDVALFLDNGKDGKTNGKGISARLYNGTVTETDLKRILPDLRDGETGTLWKITMTGENLRNTLEYAIPVDNNVTGWFYYFSGIRMEYDPVANPGSRIREITMADGQPIDPQEIYSIAVMDETVPEEYLISCEKTGITIFTVLEEAIKKAETISPDEDGRFTVAQ